MEDNETLLRMEEMMGQIVEMVTESLSGLQRILLKPVLDNYLDSFTTTLTEEQALKMCQSIRGLIDYIENGARIVCPVCGLNSDYCPGKHLSLVKDEAEDHGEN